MSSKIIISIIGGGASGCAVAIALLREIKKKHPLPPISINIFEKNNIGAGLAYGAKDPSLLLNTGVSTTSIIDGDSLDFYKWLRTKKSYWRVFFPKIKKFNRYSFMPRMLLYLYIKDRYENEKKNLRKFNCSIHQIKDWIGKIDIKNNMFLLKGEKSSYRSQYCILATGYLEGRPTSYHELKDTANYFPSPYEDIKGIKNIPKNEKILIIGTRLSAIDTAMLLQKHHHIVMASREGNLPAVRNRLHLMAAKYLTPTHQEKFFKNRKIIPFPTLTKEIERELSTIYKDKINLNQIIHYDDPLSQLREDLCLARRKLNLWEDSMMTFINFINRAWNHLSFSDKKRFLKNQLGLVYRFISAFPYRLGKIIYRMAKQKKLKIHKGLKYIQRENDGFLAHFEQNAHSFSEKFFAVINATSPEMNLSHIHNKFYINLRKDNILKLNNFGGVKVNKNLQVESEKISPKKFYACGPPIKGNLLITNFLLVSAHQAGIIAKNIIKDIINNNEA